MLIVIEDCMESRFEKFVVSANLWSGKRCNGFEEQSMVPHVQCTNIKIRKA